MQINVLTALSKLSTSRTSLFTLHPSLRIFASMKTLLLAFVVTSSLLVSVFATAAPAAPRDSSPLHVKAAYFQHDLLEKHWLDGLYVSIVPSPAPGEKLTHTVDE